MKSKALTLSLILIPVVVAMLLTAGCALLPAKADQPAKVIIVKPGDPVWLIDDVPDVQVLYRDLDGKMRYGKATLKAGCVVWYDKKWNDTTISPSGVK